MKEKNFGAIVLVLDVVFVIWFVPMAVILANVAKAGTTLYVVSLSIHILGAIALFGLLGWVAKQRERSWVKFGVLPIFFPILGPMISYIYIRSVSEGRG